MSNGIIVAGSIIVDQIKKIEGFPKRGNLVNISSISRSIGGCVCNTLIDLRKIDENINLKALGRVGKDENGSFAIDTLKKYKIDTCGVSVSDSMPTSFSDVMTERDGSRTFFTMGGACDEINFSNTFSKHLCADIFHLGYALLLGGMDGPDSEFGTVMARTLAAVRSLGIKTSMDIVSRPVPDARRIIMSSAKHCDYFIVNEIELEMAAGIKVRREDGCMDEKNMKLACERIIDFGVHEYAVIHAPEGAWAADAKGGFVFCPSFSLPYGYIKGAVGAGDAFCAGALYGFHNGWPISDTLRFGCGCAAACLSEINSIDGMRSRIDIEKLMNELDQKC